jgi:hypothetical protein
MLDMAKEEDLFRTQTARDAVGSPLILQRAFNVLGKM